MSNQFEFLPEDYDFVPTELLLDVDYSITPGRPARMNWGGLPDPPEPPEIEVEWIRTEDGINLQDLVDAETAEQIHEEILDTLYECILA